MGVAAGPDIVDDTSLELLVDIGSSRSYIGSGTSVKCIITGKTFSPDEGTPTFNTTNIAYADFEKSDNPGDNLKSTTTYSGMRQQTLYTRIGWFNIESSDGNFKPIIGNSVGNNINMGLCIVSRRLHFRQYSNSQSSGTASGDYGVSGTTQIPLNTWTHGAMVVNRVGNNVKFYINGELDASVNINTMGDSSSDTVLIGGSDADSYSGARMFDGKIACVMHYNKLLNAAEIFQNYNAFESRFK